MTKVMSVFWSASAAGVTRVALSVGIAVCAFIIWTKPAKAIENLKIVRGVLFLEGKIERGDYIKVRDFLSDATNFNKMTGEVFVASQGGNVFGALEIGSHIPRSAVRTGRHPHP